MRATAQTLQLLFCLAAFACAPAEPDAAASLADTTPPPAGPPYNDRTLPLDSLSPRTAPGSPGDEPRADRKRVAIQIEGTTDSIAVRLVRSPRGFEPAFSTYVPDDMSAQVLSDSAGLSMRFGAVFGGVPNEQAYLQIFVYAEGNTLLTAREYVHGFVRGRNPEADLTTMTDRFEWSDEAYVFQYQDVSGWIQGAIALGRHGDRFFHVLIQHPPEYGDGMAPRTALILRELRWTDTGTGLAPPG